MWYQNKPVHIPIQCQKLPLPTLIKILVPPTKETYTDGEAIDLTGIVVRAFIDDDTPWGDEDHPNGIVPLNELTIEPSVAEYGGGDIYSDGNGVNAMKFPFYYNEERELYYWYQNEEPPEGIYAYNWTPTGDLYATLYNDELYICISGTIGGNPIYYYGETVGAKGNVSSRFSVWFSNPDVMTHLRSIVPESTVSPQNVQYSDLTIQGSEQEIQLNWDRPVDSHTLTNIFTISVLPSTE